MFMADTLSKVFLNIMNDDSDSCDKLEEKVEVHIHLITKYVTVSADKMERICKET